MSYSVSTMAQGSREEGGSGLVEEVVLGIDIESVTHEDLASIVEAFEEGARTSITNSIYAPLINSFVIETSIEKRDSLVLKILVEVYYRRDLSREVIERLVDMAIERGFENAEKRIREVLRRSR